MSGAINSVGKIFNSTPGRVLAGLATGGASEIGRAAAGTARRSGVDPAITTALGYATGSRETGVQTLGGGSGPVSPAQSGGVVAAAGNVAETNADAQRELDDATRQPAATEIMAPNPDDTDEAARRRARESSQRVGGGGKRKASQTLTALGGL